MSILSQCFICDSVHTVVFAVHACILDGVDFHTKLKLHIQAMELNKAKAARSVGLPANTISSYLAKPKSIPRADIALKIARAIRVPVEWLLDDDQDWPPPSLMPRRDVLGVISDKELMNEVCRRYWLYLKDFEDAVSDAEKVDWERARDMAIHSSIAAELDSEVQRLNVILQSLSHFMLVSKLKYHVDELLPIYLLNHVDDPESQVAFRLKTIRERAMKVLHSDAAIQVLLAGRASKTKSADQGNEFGV